MEDEEVIIIDVNELPSDPEEGVWYHYNYNYYYWDSELEEFAPDRTDGKPGGGGTAENPAPVPTQRPDR